MLCAVFSWSPLAYVLLRTFGRRERPPALCAIFSWSPLAYVKGSLPFDRSLWHGPPLRRTQMERALRATEGSKKRGLPHPAAFPAGPCSHPATLSASYILGYIIRKPSLHPRSRPYPPDYIP